MQRLENIFAQTTALKMSEWASYGSHRKVTQNYSAKGRQKKIFKKSSKKKSWFEKPKSTLAEMALSSY